jgi:hypothetical protein
LPLTRPSNPAARWATSSSQFDNERLLATLGAQQNRDRFFLTRSARSDAYWTPREAVLRAAFSAWPGPSSEGAA